MVDGDGVSLDHVICVRRSLHHNPNNCPFGMAKFEVHYRLLKIRKVCDICNESSSNRLVTMLTNACFRIGKYKEFLNKYSVTSSQGEFHDECDFCQVVGFLLHTRKNNFDVVQKRGQ